MLIIAEGIDGSGKTTLITELSEAITDEHRSETVLHSSQLERHPMEEYVYRLANYDPATDHTLADRWHIGELIYGPLYRGESQLTPGMAKYVDLFLESRGALKLYMGTSFAVVESRLKLRGETFLREAHRRLVYDSYIDHCTYLDGWTTVGTNWRSDGSLQKLIDVAADREEGARRLARFSTYVGPEQPTTLLLGDRRGAQRVGRPKYRSAFVPYKDTSGHFLLTALTAAPPTVSYGIANAAEEDVPRLLKRLGDPHVLTLGSDAQHAFRSQMPGYPHLKLNHPSYVRRFSPGALYVYAELLQKAISNP